MTLTNHVQTEPITAQCPDATHTTSPGRSPVMHFPLWLFSVNSALSRPSILRGHWCWSKAFNVSLLSRTFIVRVLVFFFFCKMKCISCSQHKALIQHSTTDVTQRERGAIHLSCIHDCVLITFEKTPPPHALACLTCRPTALLPLVNPFLLLIHQLAEMEAAARRYSLYPNLVNDRRSLYHFDGSVMSRLAERMLSLWPKNPDWRQRNKKTKKEKESRFVEREAVKTEWGMDVSYQHQYHQSLACSNSLAVQLESTQLLYLIANSCVFFGLSFFTSINSVQIDMQT